MLIARKYKAPTDRWTPPTCCVPCRIDNMWDQVNSILDNMPPELWTRFLVRMYTPFLHRLVAADPKHRMPCNWITMLPLRRPPKSVRRQFYDACKFAITNPTLEGNMARPILMKMYQAIWSLLHLIQPSVDTDVFSNLWAQMAMLNGNFELFLAFSGVIKRHSPTCSMLNFARQATRCGAENHILDLVHRELSGQRRRPMFDRHAKKVSTAHHIMQNIRVGIEHVRDTTHARRLAVAMALHSRLGALSGLSLLSEEMLAKCIGSFLPELVRWDELAGNWLAM